MGGGYEGRVYLDQTPEDPREHCDTVTRIFMWGRMSYLGEKHRYSDPEECAKDLREMGELDGDAKLSELAISPGNRTNFTLRPYSGDTGRHMGLVLIPKGTEEKESLDAQRVENLAREELKEYEFWMNGES